jgi:hypothetical protein
MDIDNGSWLINQEDYNEKYYQSSIIPKTPSLLQILSFWTLDDHDFCARTINEGV